MGVKEKDGRGSLNDEEVISYFNEKDWAGRANVGLAAVVL